MIKDKYNRGSYNLEDIFESVKDELNKELKENGFQPIGLRTFKRVVKYYFKNLFMRVIYKFDDVELYHKMGFISGNKILCTSFNPKNIDVNLTDGYYYFLHWNAPKTYRRWSFTPSVMWKKKIFNNVRHNGKDYPELEEVVNGFRN